MSGGEQARCAHGNADDNLGAADCRGGAPRAADELRSAAAAGRQPAGLARHAARTGYVLAQAAETLHRLGYRGLKAQGLKGRHIEALVAEWKRQGLSDGTMRNRMAHLRWLARRIGKPGIVRRDNASYGIGTGDDRAA